MSEYELVKVSRCPVCSYKHTTNVFRKYDDRYGQPDYFLVQECNSCGSFFLGNKIANRDLSKLYKKYYSKSDKSNEKSRILSRILNKLGLSKIIYTHLAANIRLIDKVEDGSRVLEIGCGYSSDLKELIVKKRLDWLGIEVDKDLVKMISDEGLNVWHGTIDKFSSNNKKFDYVLMSQVVEHQFDIDNCFSKIRKMLSKNGRVLITTPNADSKYRLRYKINWINWHVPYHVLLLNSSAIKILSAKYGFEICKYFTFTPTSWYMLQKQFTIPERGKKNKRFSFNFSLLEQLVVSIWLRIIEGFTKNKHDCIYCELKIFKE